MATHAAMSSGEIPDALVDRCFSAAGRYRAAASNSAMPTAKSSAISHRSGSNSGQEISPTSSLPFSDITVMFRPDPWKIGPHGYIALTSEPRKYSGTCAVSYTHLRAHETDSYLVCRLL